MKGQFIISKLSDMPLVVAYVTKKLKAGAVRVNVAMAESERSIEQNDKMWACLHEVSAQIEWPVDGRLVKMSAEDWKNLFSAALKHEQRVAQGINGGFVILGSRTSKMSIKAMSDMIELVHAFGSDRDVIFKDPRAPKESDYR